MSEQHVTGIWACLPDNCEVCPPPIVLKEAASRRIGCNRRGLAAPCAEVGHVCLSTRLK